MSNIFKVLLLLCFCSVFTVRAEPNILFVNPSLPEEPFWLSVEEITVSAAKQLNVPLDVIYGGANRIVQLESLKKYLSENKKPDYAIVLNYPGGASSLMGLLEKEKIRFVTLEQTIFGEERKKIGLARDKYRYWLGEIYFDNTNAGGELAAALSQLKQEKIPSKASHVIAINGHYGSESQARFNGMRRYFEANQGIVYQAVHAGWSEEVAYKQAKALLNRFPEVNIIWTASDLMALGASKAAIELGRVPNKDIFIGGFDWVTRAVRAVETGALSASIGGHKVMGAWAVISILLHHEGEDIFAKQEKNKLLFSLDVITAKNVKSYQKHKATLDWARVDFNRLFEKVKKNYSLDDISPLDPN